MIDRFNKQHKIKNWKIISKTINKDQQDRSSRSFLEQQPKKYCPRKISSKQKIFAKSKERLNSFTAENVSEISNDHKKHSESRTQNIRAMIPLPTKNFIDQGVQTNKYLFRSQLDNSINTDNQVKASTSLQGIHQLNSHHQKYLPAQESSHTKFQLKESTKPQHQQPNYPPHHQEIGSLKNSSYLNILHLLSRKSSSVEFQQRKMSNQVVDMERFNNVIKKLKSTLAQIDAITNIDSIINFNDENKIKKPKKIEQF